MTSYISVDLGIRGASPTFWILSDYDTGFAKVIGEQSALDIAGLAQHTDRLARKHGAEEVLVHSTVGRVLKRLPDRPYEVVLINRTMKVAS